MEPAQGQSPDEQTATSSALRKWGPIGAIAVVAAVVVGVVLSGGGNDDDEPTATASATTAPTEDIIEEPEVDIDEEGEAPDTETVTETAEPERPDVLTYAMAQDMGLDVDFGDRCDPETGRVRLPWFFAPACYAPFDGDNGGATAPGVTADTIRIVYWISQESDPILAYLTDAIVNDDTNADIEDTMRALLPYNETYYETYGRSVELIVFEGTGLITDEVSARADAVQIAEELDPFMVWGGPALTSAFAEELAARGIPCLGCTPGQDYEFYPANDPYVWSVLMGPQQSGLMTAEFVARQLAGRPAQYAGDPELQTQERVFGRLWIESSAASTKLHEEFVSNLAAFDLELGASVAYALDPATIQESAASAIAKMKDAGVTTILFSGDPIAPRDFTREATAQGYFPEWMLAGPVLSDTNVFARTYDQEQWANAFGLSTLTARVNQDIDSSTFLYEWFTGESPAADDSIGVIAPLPQVFYAFLQAAGPNLTPESLRDAIFDAPPTQRAFTAQSISFGSQGRWPDTMEPDYFGIDDMTIIWWDAEDIGIDELRREGPGMWQFADMGQRYLLGEFPEAPPNIFDPATSIAVYQERPPDEPVGDYEPLSPS